MRGAARAVLLATAVAMALVWTQAVPSLFTLPKLLALCVGLTLAAALLAADRDPAAPPAGVGPPLAAVFAVLAASTWQSIDPRLSLSGRHDTWSHGVWTMALYATLFLTSAAVLPGRPAPAAWTLAGLGAWLSVHALVQRAGLDPYIVRSALPQGRAVASIGSPVDLGGALAVSWPFALWAASRARWAGTAAAVLVVGGLWACAARGAWLGAACGALAFWALQAPAWAAAVPRWLKRAAGAAVLGALVGALALTFRPGKDAARFEVWRAAGRAFLERPWLGSGPDTFEQQFRRLRGEGFVQAMRKTTGLQAYAHNDLLQAAATTGALGLAAYLGLLLALGRRSREALADPGLRGPAAAALAGLLALFVNLKFNPVSMEVLALGALAAGLLAPRGAALPAGARRAVWGAVALLGLTSLAEGRRLWTAERIEKKAQNLSAAGRHAEAMDMRRAALALNPCELTYIVALLNDAGPAINADKTEAGRLKLLSQAHDAGQAALACRPNDVNAHYAAGFAAFFHAELGLMGHLETAERQIDAALRLDPMFAPLVDLRLRIAQKRGDKATSEALRARLARLTMLSSGR